MSARIRLHTHFHRHAILVCASVAIAACCSFPAANAYAVTAAEKQAEADAVYEQIDSLQTSLNKAMKEYERAQASYDDAIAQRDQAATDIEAETAHIETLQSKLSDFAVGMYKQGGTSSYLDVLLEATTFEQFLTTWDACSSISNEGAGMINDAKQARENLVQAKASFEEQSERAEQEMAKAEEKDRKSVV